MPRTLSLLSLLAVHSASLLAQGGSARGAAPVSNAPGGYVVTVNLSEYKIEAPVTIPAGATTFRTVNKGKELHHAQLLRLTQGKTTQDFMTALQAQTQGPPPEWVEFLGGPQAASEVTIALAPGNYVWICFIPGADGKPHAMKGMMMPFTVTPATGATRPPEADIMVTASDYAWKFSRPITAGRHVFRVSTAPGQPHEFVVIRLAPGKTAQDVMAWVAKPVGPPPAESVDGIATLQPGRVNYSTINFKPGRYAIMCFVPDAKDGKEHVTHGMVQEITVQ